MLQFILHGFGFVCFILVDYSGTRNNEGKIDGSFRNETILGMGEYI